MILMIILVSSNDIFLLKKENKTCHLGRAVREQYGPHHEKNTLLNI